MRMEIGHRIKRVREQAGMSQTEFAKAVGVSRGLVGQWESHRKSPGREVLERIAKAATVSVDAILSDTSVNADAGVLVTDAEQLKMLRAFKAMSPRQRKNIVDLLTEAAEINREMQHQPSPSKRKSALV